MKLKKDRVLINQIKVNLSFNDKNKLASFFVIFAQIEKRVGAKEGKTKKIRSKHRNNKGSFLKINEPKIYKYSSKIRANSINNKLLQITQLLTFNININYS